MKPKPFFQSKTIAGAVLMGVALAGQIFKVDITQPELEQAGHDLGATVQAVGGLIGFVMVLIGRWKAERPITVRPTQD